jgi:pentatricopeptide repeat protein
MFEGLAALGTETGVTHLNRLFTLLRTASVHPVLYRDKVLVLSANEAFIRSRGFQDVTEQLDYVVNVFRELPLGGVELSQLIRLLADAHRAQDACAILHHSLEDLVSADSDIDLADLFVACSAHLENAHLPIAFFISLSKLATKIGAPVPLEGLVHAYLAVRSELTELTCCQWPVLVSAFADAQLHGDLDAFTSLEDGTPFVSTLISDIRSMPPECLVNVDMRLVDDILAPAQARLCASTSSTLPADSQTIHAAFAPHFPPANHDLCVTVDPRFSRTLDDLLHHSARNVGRRAEPGPITAFSLFVTSARSGKFPVVETIGRLINALGRMREIAKVQEVYAHSQIALASLADDKSRQAQGWFHVEDQMIEAFAHAGDVEAASVHRSRIIALGGAPSADAYGALISCIKDTTDDASVAVELFEESQRLGVRANTFLYNTLISKLSRARKAKYVLKLFRRMAEEGLRPSSVTYGAVICACCRVGDEQSAARLFEEMVAMPNFKPKATPYNTMMQAYLTKATPERDRVLYYYTELLKAKVRPTAHTYKLLIDCYGTIEPVDNRAMQKVFDQLLADPTVTVQGTHWAALINAWGCVSKNLDKALEIFDSIAKHPSTLRSRASLPDAIIFETLINVLVTLRRMDLVPGIVEQIHKSIHPTAYICNSLIKGYAASGNIEEARRTFEGLLDPPMGVAASFNHTAHERDTPFFVPINTPVYREPSTWEAMLRAELGAGNRDRAVLLLERMKTRMFPDALTSRIRRILREDESGSCIDDPVSS